MGTCSVFLELFVQKKNFFSYFLEFFSARSADFFGVFSYFLEFFGRRRRPSFFLNVFGENSYFLEFFEGF